MVLNGEMYYCFHDYWNMGIMRIKLVAVLTVIVVTATILSAYYFLTSDEPMPQSFSRDFPLIEVNLAPSGQLNATQGGVTSVNVTITSLNISETSIPLSLVLQAYDNEPLDSPISNSEQFSSTFSLNPIVLETNETKTSRLTMHVAEGVPTGKYTFLIELGNAQIHHLSGATLELNVASP
jgi:hypothetical protein